MLLSMVCRKENIKMGLQGCGRVDKSYAIVSSTVICVVDYLSDWQHAPE